MLVDVGMGVGKLVGVVKGPSGRPVVVNARENCKSREV
jgi:hypothetical protein